MRLVREDFLDDAQRIGCEVEAMMAVAAVESSGSGFNPDGTPVSLFEGHWFSKLTKGVYDVSHPTISYPKWTREFYGKTWEAERARLQEAIALDRPAALMSASYGVFQIMGLNHGYCGFPGPESFYTAMCRDENEQLAALLVRGLEMSCEARIGLHLRNNIMGQVMQLINTRKS
jgi:N-acetylmuramidase